MFFVFPVQKAFAWNYVVRQGDDISAVARLTQCTEEDILALNKLEQNASLAAGQILHIPDFMSASAVFSVSAVSSDFVVCDVPVISYTDAELDLLARCVFAEAGSKDYAGQVAVAAVVVNRVQNSRFPDTVTDVIYAPKQFECVDNGMIEKAAPQSCYDAAKTALHGADNTFGALYFWAPSMVYSAYHESLTKLCTIGDHIFATDEK